MVSRHTAKEKHEQNLARHEEIRREMREEYSDFMATLICRSVSQGMSIVQIAREDDNMPLSEAIFRWLRDHEDFRMLYEIARQDYKDGQRREVIEALKADEIDVTRAQAIIDALKI